MTATYLPDRRESFAKFQEGDWCDSAEWAERCQDRYLENYLWQNFNIPPAKCEQSPVRLPRMVPGTKNFVECDAEFADFQPFDSSLISQNVQNMVSFKKNFVVF